LAVERAVVVLAAEAREIVHGCESSRMMVNRRVIGRKSQDKSRLGGPAIALGHDRKSAFMPISTPTRVLLLRHAETAAPDRFHGAESDIPLGENGRRQAEAAAQGLSQAKPDVLYTEVPDRFLT
jgi:hypothetical protein